MSKEETLTKKQQELYDLLCFIEKIEWRMPTLSQLVGITGKSKSTLWELLKNIEKKGYIKIEKGKKRGIILEKNNYDEYIYFCEDDIKEEKNVKYRPSKSNKPSRRSIWSKK